MAEQSISARPNHVLEDPSAKTVALTYAAAFLDAARNLGEANPLEELTSLHDDVLRPHPEFSRLLLAGVLSADEQSKLIERTIAPHASTLLTNFLKVLSRHGRLELLPLILDQAWLEHERRSGKRRVQVKSSRPLTEGQLSRIQARLQTVISGEPILIPSVDPELIGGLVIQIGDTVFDGSVRTRLKNLRHSLKEGYLNEIQSGRDRFSHSQGN